MLAVPPAILELLHLHAGATVGLAIDHGRLVIEPMLRPRYSLDELLAQCDESVEISDEESAWLDSKPVGRSTRSSSKSCRKFLVRGSPCLFSEIYADIFRDLR